MDLVHHLLLYRCPPGVTEIYEAQCYTEARIEECMEVVAVWGVGGGVSFLCVGFSFQDFRDVSSF